MEPAVLTESWAEIWERYARFLRETPEIVFEWNDPLSEARGWLVINHLTGGAAGGGTRMHPGVTREEVTYLSKLMELKFGLAGPRIGGAKSGIAFDPADPRKSEVLARWFEAIRPRLRSCYGTAGDLNVDETREVIPACRAVGLGHPQEGVLRGHLKLEGDVLATRLRAMHRGIEQIASGEHGLAGRDLRVADLITGYGVATATIRLLDHRGLQPAGSRVLVQGFGCVGGAAALYLARAGVRVVGIEDAAREVVSGRGLGIEEVSNLLRRRTGNHIPEDAGVAKREGGDGFWRTHADIFVAAAASGTIDAAALNRLESLGVEMVVCGANRPFLSEWPGDTRLEESADRRFAVVADIIANCGAAHAFSQQMRAANPLSSESFFERLRIHVTEVMGEVAHRATTPHRHLLAGTLDLAMERT